jgi:hypothetical protein
VTVSQKAALSLLITVVLFAGFTVLAFTGLFDLVESHFYNPSITASLNREINTDVQSIDKFITELQNRFSVTIQNDSVKRSFLPNQSAEDIFERSRIYGMLLDSLGGFQGVRFVDSGGSRIHYSSYAADILRQDRLSVAYRNYNEENGDLPYNQIASSDQGSPRLIFDEAGDRILFSLPFYDSFNVFRGTALFSLSIRSVADRLISEGRIKVGEDVSLVSRPAGIILAMPVNSKSALVPAIASAWNDGILTLTSMDSAAEVSLALISVKSAHGFFLGSMVNEDRFIFPHLMKIILLAAFFLTVYLTVFLLFNLRQDSFTIVQNRLKQLQISLIEQYYDRKNEMDWGHWSRELEQRREEIRSELKRGIKAGAKKGPDDIDVLIDKSWDELLAVIGGRKDKAASTIDEEKLQVILNRILSAGVSIPAPAAAAGARTQAAEPLAVAPAEPAEAEPVEELADAEPLEELRDAEPAEAEAVEELADAEPLEELSDAELAGAEPVEELADAEALEELSDAEAAGAEPVEELADAEPMEELSEAEAAGAEAVEAAPAEEAGEAAEPIEELTELSEVELSAKDVDEVMGVQGDGEPAELEELDELEELGDSDEGPASEAPVDPSQMSSIDLANLVSQIEFAESTAKEIEDIALDTELEIVSPFATMLSRFSEAEEAEETNKQESASKDEKIIEKKKPEEEEAEKPQKNEPAGNAGLEALHIQNGMSLVYKPFFSDTFFDPEPLESLPNEEEPPPAIEEHEGVHYISKETLSPDPETEKNLDAKFKNLVDSVINPDNFISSSSGD